MEDEFEKGIDFFDRIWNLAIEYTTYFAKLDSRVDIRYKKTRIISYKNNSNYKYSFEMGRLFNYNIGEDNCVIPLIRRRYIETFEENKKEIISYLNELMEQPLEYYQEQINKQLADCIQQYNERNNELKKELGE